MQDEVRQTIGSIAVAWNLAENAVADMCALYLDIDTFTFDILVRNLRPQDRENLLKKIVAEREFEKNISDEIFEAMKRSQVCRENRNKILHRAGELDGNLTNGSHQLLENVLSEIRIECEYLTEIKGKITTILFDRASRNVPGEEDGTGDDELRPVLQFEAPERPKKPKRLLFEKLEIENE